MVEDVEQAMARTGVKRNILALLALCMIFTLSACRHEHVWKRATCTKPKTCSVCGETEGEALGHTWKAATCTEPRTCSECGKTKGEALGHMWKAATCTEPKTCTVCGMTEGEALGHIAPNGICERCGESLGKWIIKHYVDEFKQETDEQYIRNIDYIEGTFSNSAAKDSKLNVVILVDGKGVSFQLYEYGWNQVSGYGLSDSYSIKMKDNAGNVTDLTATLYAYGDRLHVDDEYVDTVLRALKGEGSVSFYIAKKRRPAENYLFTAECSNFAELYPMLNR